MVSLRLCLLLLCLTACVEPASADGPRCHLGLLVSEQELRHVFYTSPAIKDWSIVTLHHKAYEDCDGRREPLDVVIDPVGLVLICRGDTCTGNWTMDLDPNDCHYYQWCGPWQRKIGDKK